MMFAQRRNRLTTHLSKRIPVVKRRMTVQDSLQQIRENFAPLYNEYLTCGPAYVEKERVVEQHTVVLQYSLK